MHPIGPNPTTPVQADWYFDFNSPYAYLQLEQFDRLPPELEISLRPLVFGALLGHWEHKGPAEIPEKRKHTYRYTQFRAEQLGIPFKMPPAHPFNPLPMLRLTIALGSKKALIQKIFRYIWQQGNSVTSPQDWQALCQYLDVPNADELIQQEEVKLQLRANTERAIAQGVFGIPTFVLGTQLFWGEDATGMLLHHLAHPDWLESEELQRISNLPVGIVRKT
ncbi:2-hydroxychromene-2-carboxylate isomerase [Undibacterium sp.]|jgi:2-hydroxychromene-2-carboxylate isomerase|uniref:2-hydroxychromene-2-carboxylate isomerase n=1 Tax=Undibacterium sp. TaxID=1914977 RepID=UPI002CB3DB67|nr:2-hydroxychromene-2-carboxylate isomerase [Undibacterium sp.]HTD03050.1 2-hydroxychromene-2-carboxylate isomerase [Undibacterium sp.]